MSGGQNPAGRGGRLLLDYSGRRFCGQFCLEAGECQGIRGSLLVKMGCESCESDLNFLVCKLGVVSCTGALFEV